VSHSTISHNDFYSGPSLTWDKNLEICTNFKCGTKGRIVKNCRTTPHFVNFLQGTWWLTRHHVTYMEHREIPFNESTTSPFGDMEFHTTFIDIEYATLSVSLLLESVTHWHCYSWQYRFYSLGPMMTKHITTITSSYLLSYYIGETYLIIPRGTHRHVSRVVYSPMSIKNLSSFQDGQGNGFHLHTVEDDNQ
jgi:hypothetical protein